MSMRGVVRGAVVVGVWALAASAAGCGSTTIVDAATTAAATTTGGTTTGTGGAGGGASCPATRPVDATPCEKGLSCVYGDASCSNTFTCPEGTWMTDHHVCSSPCPASAPVPESACAEEGQSCDYPEDGEYHCGGHGARCTGGAWDVSAYAPTCQTCGAKPPEAGSTCDPCCDFTCTYTVDGCPSVQAHCLSGGGPSTWSVEGGCTPHG